jgi:ABC-type phosphate transport system substrate-binding protein
MIFSVFRPGGSCISLLRVIMLLLAVSGALLFSDRGMSPALAREKAHQADTILRITGSTTIQPIIEDLAETYTRASGEILEIQGGGSSTGIRAVLAEEAEVGMVSRSLSAAEQKCLASTIIGYDALAIIVNKRNPRTEISSRELQDIYTGRSAAGRHRRRAHPHR